jgi:hypothetical protein
MFLIYSLLILFTSFPQNDGTISWSRDRKLKYTDFKRDGSKEYALAGSYLTMKLFHKIQNDTFIYSVFPVFFKTGSYINEKHPFTLLHEQIHFNIMEIQARLIRRKFRLNATHLNNQDSIAIWVNDIYSFGSEYDRIFDAETAVDDMECSTLKKWDDTTQHILDNLEDYKLPQGAIPLPAINTK